ncbi:MAG: ABC transporter ATP-binding protein [Candidatus Kapabacteria bacterium]|nr:ABC transporter ATP-binding protein [Ignavibacteria bacterium]MBK7032320.1 ABC transporter ATP-binding protein [Ignavibacteria bacterium]MBK7412459.1 ABC transporter ATP-binding protein [Ignavibacteria bacterium]MBP6509452.1 ABC transporter ATP-binding protein [Candidatus Kapabacteria bacterium]MBP7093641.1 ABC transporter ATP-binding protein [Candidatus Kapabacteria bacterium]
MPLLTATDLHRSYRRTGQTDTEVLRGASLIVEPGEVVALVGPSGAGKSTMLHIMASLDVADRGSVHLMIDDRQVDLSALSMTALAAVRAKHIGMVFQFHHLLPEFTALENVAMPALVAGLSAAAAKVKANVLLEQVGMLHRAGHVPMEMSGGEQQRVAIARALINEPSIIFADEPTGNLDTENAATVAELLLGLRATRNVACVIATHSTELAQSAHRIVQMVDGRCIG